MALSNAAAAFIGASVTLVLVIIFMILMVILVRQCLAFLAKRNAIRAQVESQRQARENFERQRRGSITEPVPATFDWHHSIRIAGTPPPSYHEAKKLPSIENLIAASKDNRDSSSGSEDNADDERGSQNGSRRSSVVEDMEMNHVTSGGAEGDIDDTNDRQVSIAVEGLQHPERTVVGSHDVETESHDPAQDVHIDIDPRSHDPESTDL